jgi:hypothetical protein
MDFKEFSEGSQNVKATVKTDNYSWGKMKTVHHGSSFSIPLHPEHHEAIAKLKDQQEHKFKDETGRHWTAKRDGDDVHFQGANGGNKTKVTHKSIAEESHAPVAPVPDKKYIKGTPENKALKALRKPINGMPTNKMKEETMPQSFKGFLTSLNELTDKQKKHIDKNKNGQIDAHDFKLLRKEELDEALDPSEVAGNPKMYDAATVKKAYYHKKTTPEDKKTLERHLDRHHGQHDWRNSVKEDTELDELSKSTLSSYAKKASRDAVITRKIGADFENRADRARSPGMKAASNELSSRYKQKSFKRRDGLEKAVDRLTKEEIEMHEAFINGREYASHGLMHPDHANRPLHKVSGQTIDFYAHGSGDKVQGKVVYHDDKHVHIKDTNGKKHVFKISKDLPKTTNEDHKKDDVPFDGPYTKTPSTVKDKSGAVHGPMSRARDLARKAMQQKMKEEFNIEITEEQAADLCDTASLTEKVSINHSMKEETHEQDTMKSYKEFVTEIKMSDLPSRTVKGTSYGAQYHDPEGDDDADTKKSKAAKPADAPKRGRGRPSGSKSGAKQQGSEKSSNYGGIDRTTYALRLPNNNK